MFNIKRRSIIEKYNLIENNNIYKNDILNKEYISYTIGKYMFIIDIPTKKMISFYQLEENSKNYVSQGYCYSFIQRRSGKRWKYIRYTLID